MSNEFGSQVTTDYDVKKFTGEGNWVQIDLGIDAAEGDHYLKTEDRIHLAMTIQ